MNHDLKVIHEWAYQWKLEFNPDPSKQATELLFPCKKSSPNHRPIFFNGTLVTNIKEHKHLGLIFDSKLSFDKHVNEKIIKSKKVIEIIKHISRFLLLKALDQMYKTLVSSHLDYYDFIYHMTPFNSPSPSGITLSPLMEKAERTQYQAALFITGTLQGSSRTKLYEELGWESLFDRHWSRGGGVVAALPRPQLRAKYPGPDKVNNLANDPELYLYGHFSLDYIDNKRILLETIEYIKDIRRFLT